MRYIVTDRHGHNVFPARPPWVRRQLASDELNYLNAATDPELAARQPYRIERQEDQ
jgi:hypothetical protein